MARRQHLKYIEEGDLKNIGQTKEVKLPDDFVYIANDEFRIWSQIDKTRELPDDQQYHDISDDEYELPQVPKLTIKEINQKGKINFVEPNIQFHNHEQHENYLDDNQLENDLDDEDDELENKLRILEDFEDEFEDEPQLTIVEESDVENEHNAQLNIFAESEVQLTVAYEREIQLNAAKLEIPEHVVLLKSPSCCEHVRIGSEALEDLSEATGEKSTHTDTINNSGHSSTPFQPSMPQFPSLMEDSSGTESVCYSESDTEYEKEVEKLGLSLYDAVEKNVDENVPQKESQRINDTLLNSIHNDDANFDEMKVSEESEILDLIKAALIQLFPGGERELPIGDQYKNFQMLVDFGTKFTLEEELPESDARDGEGNSVPRNSNVFIADDTTLLDNGNSKWTSFEDFYLDANKGYPNKESLFAKGISAIKAFLKKKEQQNKLNQNKSLIKFIGEKNISVECSFISNIQQEYAALVFFKTGNCDVVTTAVNASVEENVTAKIELVNISNKSEIAFCVKNTPRTCEIRDVFQESVVENIVVDYFFANPNNDKGNSSVFIPTSRDLQVAKNVNACVEETMNVDCRFVHSNSANENTGIVYDISALGEDVEKGMTASTEETVDVNAELVCIRPTYDSAFIVNDIPATSAVLKSLDASREGNVNVDTNLVRVQDYGSTAVVVDIRETCKSVFAEFHASVEETIDVNCMLINYKVQSESAVVIHDIPRTCGATILTEASKEENSTTEFNLIRSPENENTVAVNDIPRIGQIIFRPIKASREENASFEFNFVRTQENESADIGQDTPRIVESLVVAMNASTEENVNRQLDLVNVAIVNEDSLFEHDIVSIYEAVSASVLTSSEISTNATYKFTAISSNESSSAILGIPSTISASESVTVPEIPLPTNSVEESIIILDNIFTADESELFEIKNAPVQCNPQESIFHEITSVINADEVEVFLPIIQQNTDAELILNKEPEQLTVNNSIPINVHKSVSGNFVVYIPSNIVKNDLVIPPNIVQNGPVVESQFINVESLLSIPDPNLIFVDKPIGRVLRNRSRQTVVIPNPVHVVDRKLNNSANNDLGNAPVPEHLEVFNNIPVPEQLAHLKNDLDNGPAIQTAPIADLNTALVDRLLDNRLVELMTDNEDGVVSNVLNVRSPNITYERVAVAEENTLITVLKDMSAQLSSERNSPSSLENSLSTVENKAPAVDKSAGNDQNKPSSSDIRKNLHPLLRFIPFVGNRKRPSPLPPAPVTPVKKMATRSSVKQKSTMEGASRLAEQRVPTILGSVRNSNEPNMIATDKVTEVVKVPRGRKRKIVDENQIVVKNETVQQSSTVEVKEPASKVARIDEPIKINEIVEPERDNKISEESRINAIDETINTIAETSKIKEMAEPEIKNAIDEPETVNEVPTLDVDLIIKSIYDIPLIPEDFDFQVEAPMKRNNPDRGPAELVISNINTWRGPGNRGRPSRFTKLLQDPDDSDTYVFVPSPWIDPSPIPRDENGNPIIAPRGLFPNIKSDEEIPATETLDQIPMHNAVKEVDMVRHVQEVDIVEEVQDVSIADESVKKVLNVEHVQNMAIVKRIQEVPIADKAIEEKTNDINELGNLDDEKELDIEKDTETAKRQLIKPMLSNVPKPTKSKLDKSHFLETSKDEIIYADEHLDVTKARIIAVKDNRAAQWQKRSDQLRANPVFMEECNEFPRVIKLCSNMTKIVLPELSFNFSNVDEIKNRSQTAFEKGLAEFGESEIIPQVSFVKQLKIKRIEEGCNEWGAESDGKCFIPEHLKDPKVDTGVKEEKTYKCQWRLCELETEDHFKFITHVEEHHLELACNSSKYYCLWKNCPCENTPFKTKKLLRIHSRSHTSENPHACEFPFCRKTFIRHENLKTHYFGHSNLKPYLCIKENCNMYFTNASDRKKHVDKRHKENKRYFHCPVAMCCRCGGYRDASSLRKHMKHAHGDASYDMALCFKYLNGDLGSYGKITMPMLKYIQENKKWSDYPCGSKGEDPNTWIVMKYGPNLRNDPRLKEYLATHAIVKELAPIHESWPTTISGLLYKCKYETGEVKVEINTGGAGLTFMKKFEITIAEIKPDPQQRGGGRGKNQKSKMSLQMEEVSDSVANKNKFYQMLDKSRRERICKNEITGYIGVWQKSIDEILYLESIKEELLGNDMLSVLSEFTLAGNCDGIDTIYVQSKKPLQEKTITLPLTNDALKVLLDDSYYNYYTPQPNYFQNKEITIFEPMRDYDIADEQEYYQYQIAFKKC
uniref:C2H2-type domain-containing protein n=1 Tax=Rhabditophanes sp. KR3021 TaxID=114890 RepID=A0AC35TII0_9BILA